MNKSELITAMAADSGLSKADTEKAQRPVQGGHRKSAECLLEPGGEGFKVWRQGAADGVRKF